MDEDTSSGPRKSAKRRRIVSDDEDEPSVEQPVSPGFPQPQHEELIEPVMEEPIPEASPADLAPKRRLTKRKSDARPASRKKRRTDPDYESEDEPPDDDRGFVNVDEDDDEDFIDDEQPKKRPRLAKAPKPRATNAGKTGKKPTAAKAGKTEAPKHLEIDDLPDVSTDAPATPTPASASVPPKRKLPTIKKTTGPKGLKDPAKIPDLPSQPITPTARPSLSNHIAKLSATTDVDLSDKSVYASLFRAGSGNNTPRSGIIKKEDRQKEITKMREDAKAARVQAATESFDLQGQMEKVLRFEERLRFRSSSVLYPNILGAKWKEKWERDRQDNRHASQMSQPLEEGEV